MASYRSIKTVQEVVVNSSERYVPPVHIPVFSFPSLSEDDQTPIWSPEQEILITDIVAYGELSEDWASQSYTQVSVLRKDFMSGTDIVLGSVVVANSSTRATLHLANNFTKDNIISSYDGIYCKIDSEDGAHLTLSVSIYGERYRKR